MYTLSGLMMCAKLQMTTAKLMSTTCSLFPLSLQDRSTAYETFGTIYRLLMVRAPHSGADSVECYYMRSFRHLYGS